MVVLLDLPTGDCQASIEAEERVNPIWNSSTDKAWGLSCRLTKNCSDKMCIQPPTQHLRKAPGTTMADFNIACNQKQHPLQSPPGSVVGSPDIKREGKRPPVVFYLSY